MTEARQARRRPETASERVIWDQGRTPGLELVALGSACTLTYLSLSLAITGSVSWLFDLPFVLTCIALALAVRPGDFFHIGILPPLLILGSFLLVAVSNTGAIASADDSVVQAVISGLAHHSLALVLGYLGSLGVLAIRERRARLLDVDLLDSRLS